MRELTSCGVLVFRRQPELSFLLLRHPNRFDLPKGHRAEGETEAQCAWRELAEETGLASEDVRLEEGFRFASTYYPRYRRFGGEVVQKTVVVFLGWLVSERKVAVSEHGAFEWVAWRPPHRIEAGTIDQALGEVERFFAALRIER
jgi:8-oxo-dGTP pyrophosphatase MutT (NUDIX family)